VKIDAVAEGTGEAGGVAGHAGIVAAAVAELREPPAAGARIRRRRQLEMGGELRGALGPRDQHPPLLDHLAERLQAAPLELRKLVEEEDAAMGQRDFTGPRRRATPQETRPAGGMMGSAEGAFAHQGRISVEATGRAVDSRHLERLLEFEPREQSWEAPRQERLPCSGRAEKE
jgi:hypothetical protein